MFHNKEAFKDAFIKKIKAEFGISVDQATDEDVYSTLGAMVKEELGIKWQQTNQYCAINQVKQVNYFSMEFLLGRLLGNNLINLDILNLVKQGLQELGFDLSNIKEQEFDPGLGNGGLGRLAACFLESFASLGRAGQGQGIRYRYGMFDQHFVEGYQVELPDPWLTKPFLWETRREKDAVEVRFGGHITILEKKGRLVFEHTDYESHRAVPYDVPIIGYKNDCINTLRLWSAEPTEQELLTMASPTEKLSDFLSRKRAFESISDFLYPDDSHLEGRILRLKQEYFLVSAGVQDIVRSFEKLSLPWSAFPDEKALHINDTHPALVIPELMRILMDEKQLGWNEAWEITQKSVSYTNHTTLREALETWPVDMVQQYLPRVYMIMEEINERFCRDLWNLYPGNFNRIAELAIISDGQVKMAHLSIVGSHSVNGVAKLHTEILKKREMKSFYEVFPERFNNKTNGISQRRWLIHANPLLTQLINDKIGEDWMKDPKQLQMLLSAQNDPILLDRLHEIKQKNKIKLSNWVKSETGFLLDPHSIFDVQIKRLHGYKRQLLNALYIIHLYNEIKMGRGDSITPTTFLFAAKAAPSYYFAKKVIKLINRISEVINRDAHVKELLNVIFLENYSISLAERIIPAANVSEQISTASKEASGTGNMKLMMNGALTLGTMDGANVEIYDLVGENNIYTFGLSSDEVLMYNERRDYYSKVLYEEDERIRGTLDQLIFNSPFTENGEEFRDLFDALIYEDEYFVLKDFQSYVDAHQLIHADYQNRREWSKKSLINIAQSGMFSSDYTFEAYANEIWNIKPKMTVSD